MQLVLPEYLGLRWCETGSAADAWLHDADSSSHTAVVRAAAPILYVDPACAALLAAWAARWRRDGGTVDVDPSLRTVQAFRSGLLSALAGRDGHISPESDRRLLRQVTSPAGIRETVAELQGLLRLREPGQREALRYFVSELLHNVFEHASTPDGAFLAAGYYQRGRRVTFAICDAGVSIPTHFRYRWSPDLSDAAALRCAIEPAASGSLDRDRNAGLGLYMTRRIVALMGGAFYVLSGAVRAEAEGRKGARPGGIEVAGSPRPWPGTLVVATYWLARSGAFSKQFAIASEELDAPELEGFFTRHVPADATVVLVEPDASTFAQDKAVAAALRDEELQPALDRGERVVLDLRRVALTTQSYAHALVAAPLRSLDVDAGERLRVACSSPQVKQVFRTVLRYLRDESG